MSDVDMEAAREWAVGWSADAQLQHCGEVKNRPNANAAAAFLDLSRQLAEAQRERDDARERSETKVRIDAEVEQDMDTLNEACVAYEADVAALTAQLAEEKQHVAEVELTLDISDRQLAEARQALEAAKERADSNYKAYAKYSRLTKHAEAQLAEARKALEMLRQWGYLSDGPWARKIIDDALAATAKEGT
jgi:chromosome segregation ATPase